VREQQHWMVDFYIKTLEVDKHVLGRSVLISAQHGDYRTMDRLLKCGADPNYGYSLLKGHQTSALLLAGERL
jgi:hypothetical protein